MISVKDMTSYEIARLEAAYNEAVEKNEEMFSFQGHDVLVAYAKYLLEYLNDN